LLKDMDPEEIIEKLREAAVWMVNHQKGAQ
jgi:hypothetical protein